MIAFERSLLQVQLTPLVELENERFGMVVFRAEGDLNGLPYLNELTVVFEFEAGRIRSFREYVGMPFKKLRKPIIAERKKKAPSHKYGAFALSWVGAVSNLFVNQSLTRLLFYLHPAIGAERFAGYHRCGSSLHLPKSRGEQLRRIGSCCRRCE